MFLASPLFSYSEFINTGAGAGSGQTGLSDPILLQIKTVEPDSRLRSLRSEPITLQGGNAAFSVALAGTLQLAGRAARPRRRVARHYRAQPGISGRIEQAIDRGRIEMRRDAPV